jgi:hypothetical protein
VAKKVQLSRLRLMARAGDHREQLEPNQPCTGDGGQQSSFRVIRAVLQKAGD